MLTNRWLMSKDMAKGSSGPPRHLPNNGKIHTESFYLITEMHTPQRFHSVTGKMGITYEAYVVFLS
jgi:hypothetical protein